MGIVDSGVPQSPIPRRGTEARKNDPLAREIARLLNNYRRRKRLSIEDLARESGIAATDIRRFERGTHAPGLTELIRLGAVFGVSAYKIAKRIDAFHARLTREAAASERLAS